MSIFQAVIYTGFYTFNFLQVLTKWPQVIKSPTQWSVWRTYLKLMMFKWFCAPRDMFLGVVGYHIKNQRLLKQTLSVLSPRVWGQDIYPCVKFVDFWYIVHYQDIIIERWARHSFQVKLTAYLPGEKKA